ncbi:MAG TPA: RNA polymerase sigma factor [Solirubrobacteraceae bacterium]
MSPWLSDLFLSSQSDERLVALAGAGHDRAFAVIVERYRGELHAHARRLCSDGHAEDIVQQAFLSAFAALRAGTEVRHLRGWLYQIVRHAAARIHAPRDAPLDEESITSAPLEDVMQERALALSALSELGRLPDRQRQALVGTVQGRRRVEIARSMGLSEGAVRQLVHRARMTVRAAATAVTPYPLLRWLSARAPGDSEVAIGAGAASAGGATVKLGALLASGVIASGIVVDVNRTPSAHHSSAAAGAPALHVRGNGGGRAAVAPAAAGTAARALGSGLQGTLPAVLGRGGAAGTRGHGLEPRDQGAGSHDGGQSNRGRGGRSGGGPGPSRGGPSSSGGTGSGSGGSDSGSGSGSGSGSTGSSDSSGSSGSSTAGSSGDSGHSGGGGSTSGDGGGRSMTQTSDGGSRGSSPTSSTSGGSGDGTTSGEPVSPTASSSSGTGGGTDGGGGSSGSGRGSSGSGRDGDSTSGGS